MQREKLVEQSSDWLGGVLEFRLKYLRTNQGIVTVEIGRYLTPTFHVERALQLIEYLQEVMSVVRALLDIITGNGGGDVLQILNGSFIQHDHQASGIGTPYGRFPIFALWVQAHEFLF
jgi:hypothetical protein